MTRAQHLDSNQPLPGREVEGNIVRQTNNTALEVPLNQLNVESIGFPVIRDSHTVSILEIKNVHRDNHKTFLFLVYYRDDLLHSEGVVAPGAIVFKIQAIKPESALR